VVPVASFGVSIDTPRPMSDERPAPAPVTRPVVVERVGVEGANTAETNADGTPRKNVFQRWWNKA
jgi:hypothetical protein